MTRTAVSGGRDVPEHHWLRTCPRALLERRGPLETVRLIGMVLWMFALVILTDPGECLSFVFVSPSTPKAELTNECTLVSVLSPSC